MEKIKKKKKIRWDEHVILTVPCVFFPLLHMTPGLFRTPIPLQPVSHDRLTGPGLWVCVQVGIQEARYPNGLGETQDTQKCRQLSVTAAARAMTGLN